MMVNFYSSPAKSGATGHCRPNLGAELKHEGPAVKRRSPLISCFIRSWSRGRNCTGTPGQCPKTSAIQRTASQKDSTSSSATISSTVAGLVEADTFGSNVYDSSKSSHFSFSSNEELNYPRIPFRLQLPIPIRRTIEQVSRDNPRIAPVEVSADSRDPRRIAFDASGLTPVHTPTPLAANEPACPLACFESRVRERHPRKPVLFS